MTDERFQIGHRFNQAFILALGVRSPNDSATSAELNNIVSSQVLDPIQRIAGVSAANQFGSSYSMRSRPSLLPPINLISGSKDRRRTIASC